MQLHVHVDVPVEWVKVFVPTLKIASCGVFILIHHRFGNLTLSFKHCASKGKVIFDSRLTLWMLFTLYRVINVSLCLPTWVVHTSNSYKMLRPASRHDPCYVLFTLATSWLAESILAWPEPRASETICTQSLMCVDIWHPPFTSVSLHWMGNVSLLSFSSCRLYQEIMYLLKYAINRLTWMNFIIPTHSLSVLQPVTISSCHHFNVFQRNSSSGDSLSLCQVPDCWCSGLTTRTPHWLSMLPYNMQVLSVKPSASLLPQVKLAGQMAWNLLMGITFVWPVTRTPPPAWCRLSLCCQTTAYFPVL